MNHTKVSYFVLAAYLDPGPLRFLFFSLVLVLLLLVVFCNVLLIVVICVSRSLHEPMFLFLCSLFANELLGGAGLLPFLLLQLLSHVHRVPAPLCFLQVFVLYSYAGVELSNLAVMSYDRYLAICCPLQYQTLMTPSRTGTLLVLVWFYPLLAVMVLVSVTSSLQRCGNLIHGVFCDNYSIVKLACSDTTFINVYGLAILCLLVVFPALLILYSYARILQVCLRGSRQTRHKAVSTCTPHLASLLNFSFGCVFEIVQSRFDMSGVPGALRVLLSVYYLTCQPLFNPVLYGLNLTRIRSLCGRVFCGER